MKDTGLCLPISEFLTRRLIPICSRISKYTRKVLIGNTLTRNPRNCFFRILRFFLILEHTRLLSMQCRSWVIMTFISRNGISSLTERPKGVCLISLWIFPARLRCNPNCRELVFLLRTSLTGRNSVSCRWCISSIRKTKGLR